MKLCANLSFMFQEEEDLVARSVLILIFIFDIMTIVRYRAARQAGFSAVEVAHPYNEDMEALTKVLMETGLKQVIRIPSPVIFGSYRSLRSHYVSVHLSVTSLKFSIF